MMSVFKSKATKPKKDKLSDDYWKGIKIVTEEAKKNNINIRRKKYEWLIDFSYILSLSNRCYEFWKAVKEQDRFDHISYVNNLEEIMYTSACLFIWEYTEGGHVYWEYYFMAFRNILGKRAEDIKLDDFKNNMLLKDVNKWKEMKNMYNF